MSNKDRYLQSKQAAQASLSTKEWSLKGDKGMVITQLYRMDLKEVSNVLPVNYAAHVAKLNRFEQSFCNKNI